MLSDTELIVNSRLIVTGRVTSIISAWDDAGSMVYTYVEVLTDRVLKGELHDTTIVLKQLGGMVGESGIRVSGQPEFSTGERVLLYLNTAPDGSTHSAHAFIGKFSVIADPGGAQFVQRSVDAGDVEVLSRADGEVTNRAPFDSYVEKIHQTLRREATRVAEIDSEKAGQPLVAVPTEYARKRRELGDVLPQFVLFGGGVRWMEADTGQPVSYYVNPNSSPIAGGGASEITRAMNAWPNQSGASIRLQVAGQTGSCGIVFDNVNTISFGDCMNQLDPGIGCAGVVALTSVSWSYQSKVIGGVSYNRLLEADVVFNKGIDCFLSNSANLAEVACHELGHSIGLAHSADPTALMWATAHGHGRDAALGADDRTGVLSIYPASAGGGPPAPAPVSITSLSMSEGVTGQYYSAGLTATGGTPPYRWSLIGGALPPGLNFTSLGTIEGFPTSTGSYSFAVQVIDSGNPLRTDSRWLSISVRAGDGGGGSVSPSINRVKQKGSKKLWVFGENFRVNSLVSINGLVFQPIAFEQSGTAGQLQVKGKLHLGATGTNYVVVLNGDRASAAFFF
jgi:hypothetical protein